MGKARSMKRTRAMRSPGIHKVRMPKLSLVHAEVTMVGLLIRELF